MSMRKSSPMQICILEDNPERQAAMRDCVKDRFHQYKAIFFNDAALMIEHLRSHLSEVIAISLDHDLELIPNGKGKPTDPGTGRHVANFLAELTPTCPIVIHSTNSAAAQGMQMLLDEKGWKTHLVHPRGDLEWIGTEWFQAMRKALLETARSNKIKSKASTAG
jgi:Cyclic-phosphate processing Receiver domain